MERMGSPANPLRVCLYQNINKTWDGGCALMGIAAIAAIQDLAHLLSRGFCPRPAALNDVIREAWCLPLQSEHGYPFQCCQIIKVDALVKSRKTPLILIPVEAGIQEF
jgi:hypothetical protein